MSVPVHAGLDGLVTLVGGATVCVARPDGVITPDRLTGLYHRDVRVLSRSAVRIDGVAPRLLDEARETAATTHHVFVVETNAHGDPTAVLIHRRTVDGELRDDYELRVHAGAVVDARIELDVAVDLADLLALKEGAPAPAALPLDAVTDDRWRAGDGRVAVEIAVDRVPATCDGATVTWAAQATPSAPWSVTVTVRPVSPPVGRRTAEADDERLRVDTPSAWAPAVRSALGDLQALRCDLPDRDLSYLAAGAPWFMALFGRDSLLTAWMSLIAGTALTLDILEGLARYQGVSYDPETLEQPGRILHELRTGERGVFGLDSGRPYYGTVDASALFVMVLAEAYRWGAERDRVAALLPAARAALDWCLGDGDLDGDGFVEYVAQSGGLANQGWKDSGDAMVHADGSLATGPIALAEVQAYGYRALLDLARLETDVGDPERAPALRERAAALQDRFVDSFWLADRAMVAMALDGDKRPLAVASSNAGHCLWAGILPPPHAAALATSLAAPALRTAWGLRTLAASERAYNPLSYHLGSIWPHDSAIVAAGLMRAGSVEAAQQVTHGLLAACRHFDWRLPELFGGFDRDELHFPVSYPVACSPQAWSAAAPLLLLRTMLRLHPDVPAGTLHLSPVFDRDTALSVTGIAIGDSHLDVEVRGGETTVTRHPPTVVPSFDRTLT